MLRKCLPWVVCLTVLCVSGLAIADGDMGVDGGAPLGASDGGGSDAAIVDAEETGETPPRILEFRFNPASRAQIALWITRSSPTPHFQTLRLTEAVARRGIANRPGALQMNSGFRWPYGRREGVLPVWAHQRVIHGNEPFPRVIFRDRTSEGAASQSPAGTFPGTAYTDNPDEYFCLSFRQAVTNEERRREALDAVSCASTFNSDKGRYITNQDVSAQYSEPEEHLDGMGVERILDLTSFYPPRRDVSCPTCPNHPDVLRFAVDTAALMPEIDAVSMATLSPQPFTMLFTVPNEWPEGEYSAFIEVNIEGDYSDHEVGGTHPEPDYPTPTVPGGQWDYWAMNTGYPYRGQPSVVYRVDFGLEASREYSAEAPMYRGSIDGQDDDELHEILPGEIVDDPVAAPGSGADRLRKDVSGARFVVRVQTPEFCEGNRAPATINDLVVAAVSDEKHSHQWGHMTFSVPSEDRGLQSYDVRVSTSPIVDLESFLAGVPANAASIDTVGLYISPAGFAGDPISVDFGGLMPETKYFVGIRAIDVCNRASAIAVATLSTTPIHFTTVSPCFVATAAYGSPLASEIGVLRRFRDRHLMNNEPGRALVDAYYHYGPGLAAIVREHESLRRVARAMLAPVVSMARAIDDDDTAE